jgi:hypothetical protein
MTASSTAVARKHFFQGEVIEGVYDVFDRASGRKLGQVRKGTAPNGYWGCWMVYPQGFATRREAVQHLVNKSLLPREGCDRCGCGCKYWEDGRCIDCGERFRVEDHREDDDQ